MEYPGDLLPFPSACLLSSLPHLHERVIRDPSKPSSVRVLGRSLFMVAAGWLIAFGWLWVGRPSLAAHLFTATSIAAAVIAAALMVLIGCVFARYAGCAPYAELEWREWRHAFWWSSVPNALLLATTWLILSSEF